MLSRVVVVAKLKIVACPALNYVHLFYFLFFREQVDSMGGSLYGTTTPQGCCGQFNVVLISNPGEFKGKIILIDTVGTVDLELLLLVLRLHSF